MEKSRERDIFVGLITCDSREIYLSKNARTSSTKKEL